MTKILLTLIIVSIIGIVAFFYFSNSNTLKERTFTIQENTYSILVPQNLKYRSKANSAIFIKSGEEISGVTVGLPDPTNLTQTQPRCKEFVGNSNFTAHINSLNKSVEVCDIESFRASLDSPLADYRYLESIIEYRGGFYSIAVVVKGTYIETEEGKLRTKQIFESFRILN